MFYEQPSSFGLLAAILAVLFLRLPGRTPIRITCVSPLSSLYAIAFASTHRLSLPAWLLLIIAWAAGLY